MLIIKFLIIFIMLIGLMCTLAPRLHGTLMILIAAGIYAIFTDVSVFSLWVAVYLLILTLIAEIGANGLRILLTRNSEVSMIYSIDTTVCNLAGIVVSDALLGSLIGMSIWEIMVGKTLFPRIDSIGKVLVRLIAMAALRLICGLIMLIIVIKYMM